MGILAWVVLGLIAGVLAKFIMPGDQPGGIIITILLGIAGALVGGFIGHHLFGIADINSLSLHSILVAVAGAILILFGYRMLKK